MKTQTTQATEKENEMKNSKSLEREYDNLYNEGGEGYNPYRDGLGSDDVEPEVWDIETTKARRIEWNSLNVTLDTRVETERKLGWKFHQLRYAIEQNGL